MKLKCRVSPKFYRQYIFSFREGVANNFAKNYLHR